MAKSKSISTNVARILAEKIVKELKEKDGGKKEQLKKMNDEINASPEVKKGLQVSKELDKINQQILTKYGKYLNSAYKKTQYFATITAPKTWLSDYMIESAYKIPSVESVQDEIILESAFSEAGSPEEVIAKYISKYQTKPTTKTK